MLSYQELKFVSSNLGVSQKKKIRKYDTAYIKILLNIIID